MKKNKVKIKHVIFDWSGTLCDDHRASWLATRRLVRKLCKKNISYSCYRDRFTLPAKGFYDRLGIRIPFRVVNKSYFDLYENYRTRMKLFAGVRPCLKWLKKNGVTASVFSTMRQDLLDALCHGLGVKKYFTAVQGSVINKVHELNAHLKKLHVKPQNILYIGDMDHDVKAANVHGVVSGCVLSGYHRKERLARASPRFVWNHQKDWLPFFKKICAPGKVSAKKAGTQPVATSGILVENQKGEVLLVLTHKWGYTYGIPGGKIEKGETARDAAVREIKEETALRVDVRDLLLVQDCIDPPEFYIPHRHFLLFNFRGRALSNTVKLNHEAVSYLWVKPQLALKLALNQPTRALILKSAMREDK